MSLNTLINYLKNKKVYVISPHFDDAVYSMGMLLYELKKYGNVTIINVFTKSHKGPYTYSAKKNIKVAGFTNAVDLYKNRLKEDTQALSAVNAKQVNLDLTEALYRRKIQRSFLNKLVPEFEHVYPTYRWHIIKSISAKDHAAQDLKQKLLKIIPQNAVIFSPLGIGNHADHVIVHKVCSELFQNNLYYVDFPYNIKLNNFGQSPEGYREFDLDVDLTIKSKLVNIYKSQYTSVFTTGIIPEHKEKFYIPKYIFKNE